MLIYMNITYYGGLVYLVLYMHPVVHLFPTTLNYIETMKLLY